ncbi:IclR family transcriptional regulator [Cellulomonas sp. KRMCY2]|uniref:IclR family transcriptional regulator n=1 Tax=Cellulomonas sp. KRMCY2 TaxID=1304865 RepID=UPI00045E6BFA|nr:IclR family transcriptional regulator [Cellulomonas sp. KRMCY2]
MNSTRRTDIPEPADEPRLVGADRVLAVLTELSGHPQGISLDDLSRIVDSPKPTVHRALAALRRAGFATQDVRGRYVLGDEFLRLAFTHHEARPDHVRVTPVLEALSERFGETTHYAVLDDDTVIYRSKVDPLTGGVRLTSTVGGRNGAHATGVGKLLLALALRDDDAVRSWAAGRVFEARTPRTLTSTDALVTELATIREQGYAVDDQENEPGIVCVAVPAYLTSPTAPSGAISVSALAYRTPLATLLAELPAIREIVDAISTRGADSPRDVPTKESP